jgi:hypothetical protein
MVFGSDRTRNRLYVSARGLTMTDLGQGNLHFR